MPSDRAVPADGASVDVEEAAGESLLAQRQAPARRRVRHWVAVAAFAAAAAAAAALVFAGARPRRGGASKQTMSRSPGSSFTQLQEELISSSDTFPPLASVAVAQSASAGMPLAEPTAAVPVVAESTDMPAASSVAGLVPPAYAYAPMPAPGYPPQPVAEPAAVETGAAESEDGFNTVESLFQPEASPPAAESLPAPMASPEPAVEPTPAPEPAVEPAVESPSVEDEEGVEKDTSVRAPEVGDEKASDCPPEGEDCSATRCCAESGFQCYRKNKEWASCLTNCTKGMVLPDDPEPTPWDCEELGAPTPEIVHTVTGSGWIQGAPRGEDCTSSDFCAGMDDSCYMRDQEYGSCMMKCDPKASATKGWTCQKKY